MAMNSLVPSHIQVTIVRARDLALKSKSVNSDVFAVVQVEKEKQVTQLLPRHSCPQWNQSFDIPLMSLDSSVDITIKQKTKFAEEFIGYTRVPFNHLSISRRVRQNWHKLGPRPGKTSSKPRGDILLSLSFLYKWDSVETSPISSSFEERDRRMLRRTKSEYKSGTGGGAGGNAKSERQIKSKGSIFGRAKNKKNQIFEDNDDFVALSIRSSSDPPTPPQSERRKQILLSSSSPERTEGDIPNEARSSSPTHLLFTEATQQLEKTGIVDLWRADPVIRREAVKQKIRDNEASKLGSSSIPTVKKESSFDSSYEEDTSRHSASTPTNTPTRSNTITYRARSTPRRRERTNSSGNVLGSPKTSRERVTPHASNTSLESNTSEYYSAGSSINNTPSTCNTMSFNGEVTPTNTTPPREKEAVEKISRDSSDGGTQTTPTLEPRSPQKRGKLKRGATLDTPSSYSTLPHRHSKVHINDHSFSTLQRSPTKDIERAKPRNPQQQYLTATSTNNIKRHSADIAQILKLGSLSQGRNDGLENVLNAGQLKQLLQKRNSRGNAETGADSPVSKTRNVSSTLPLAKSPNPVSPTGNKDISTSADTPKEVKKEALILDDETPSKPSLQNGRLLISDDDQDTRGSTSDNSPQLLLKADVAISVDTATSSGSTTPSRMSPPLTSTDVTRETTPSPEGEDETDDGKEPRAETKKKHTVEYKKSFDGGNNFQPFRPLPPSVAAISASNSSANSPSHYPQKKYSSTTDITTLLNQCKEIVSTGNSIELSSVHSSHSATNSGRASPVILEEEEEEEGEIKANTTPLTPTTPPINVPTPNTVKSAPKTSASVSRRKTGGGLKRALSLYQESRKQVPSSSPASKGKRTESTSSNKPPGIIRRNSSSDKSKKPEINKPSQKPTNPLPPPPPTLTSLPKHVPSTSTAPSTVSAVGVMGSKTSLGASFTASKSNSNSATTKQNEATEKLAVATPNGLLSSHETHHSSSSSSSSSHTKTHTDPITTSNHFTLPPPPPPNSQEDAGHVESVESVSGEGGVSSSSTDTPSMSSCSEHESSCTTSSSEWDEEETTTEEDYCEWSKEALISELVRAKSKLKRRTLELQDTKSYLEVLLVKVMNFNPELLLSDSS